MTENTLEQEIEDSLDDIAFASVSDVEARIEQAQKIAANTLKKNKKITIRMSDFDIHSLKRIAANEGVPYQTLITSVLHKFATEYNTRPE